MQWCSRFALDSSRKPVDCDECAELPRVFFAERRSHIGAESANE